MADTDTSQILTALEEVSQIAANFKEEVSKIQTQITSLTNLLQTLKKTIKQQNREIARLEKENQKLKRELVEKSKQLKTLKKRAQTAEQPSPPKRLYPTTQQMPPIYIVELNIERSNEQPSRISAELRWMNERSPLFDEDLISRPGNELEICPKCQVVYLAEEIKMLKQLNKGCLNCGYQF